LTNTNEFLEGHRSLKIVGMVRHFLLTSHIHNEPISYRFRDKRRF